MGQKSSPLAFSRIKIPTPLHWQNTPPGQTKCPPRWVSIQLLDVTPVYGSVDGDTVNTGDTGTTCTVAYRCQSESDTQRQTLFGHCSEAQLPPVGERQS